MKETIYEIRVKGILDSRWSAMFAPLELVPRQDETSHRRPYSRSVRVVWRHFENSGYGAAADFHQSCPIAVNPPS